MLEDEKGSRGLDGTYRTVPSGGKMNSLDYIVMVYVGLAVFLVAILWSIR
jgi:hypothetical protein